jgi:hypothetical protein
MKRMHLLVFFAFVLVQAGAQSLPQQVVASAGGFASHATTGSLHWTAGETIIQTFVADRRLTQGFQQYRYFLTPVYDHPSLDFTVRVFPNPTDGTISISTEGSTEVRASMYTLQGQCLRQDAFTGSCTLDVSTLPSGSFLLRLSANNQLAKAIRIVKL